VDRVAMPGVLQAARCDGVAVERCKTVKDSSNCGARATISPSWSIATEWPSNISSS